MRLEPRIPRLRRFFRLPDRRIEGDVDDEIAFHLESRINALVARGENEGDARRLAEVEFGDLGASRRELVAVDRQRRRRERLTHLIETVVQDLRYATRALVRSPAYTATALVTLIIGIASVVTLFAVVDGVLLRPLPYPNPDRLIGVWHDLTGAGLNHSVQTATTYLTYETQARTIDGIGIYQEGAVNVADDHTANEPQRVTATLLTASTFSVLGISPIRGRVFTRDEDQPTATPVMLISDGMWRSRFGADPKIVGRRLEVNGVQREIVGVMPQSFRFPSAATEIWVPLALDRTKPPATAFSYVGVARLKRGVTLADAQRDFSAVLPRMIELFPDFVPGISTKMMMDQAKPRPLLTRLRDDVTGGIAGTLWMMAVAAALLLVVACVNVASLTLVRFDARQRELAVRQALGAGVRRVTRYYFSESLLLAATAGIIGVAVAWGVIRILITKGPADLPRLAELGIDARTLLLAAVVSAAVAVACSLAPVLRIRRGSLSLRDPRGGNAGRQQHRLRSALVAVQVAMSLVVLSGSALLLRSFERLHSVRLGFDAEHTLVVWTSLPRSRYVRDTAIVRFYSSLVDGVAQLPGVQSVGVTSRLPLVARGVNRKRAYPERGTQDESKLPPLEILTTVGGDFFGVMRIPLVAGRVFDGPATAHEGDAIISRGAAELLWNDSTGVSALGKRFRAVPAGPWYTVIGVVGDAVDTTLAAPPSASIYFPEIIQHDSITPQTSRTMALVVRTAGEPSALAPEVRRLVQELDPTLPTFDVQPLSATIRASTARLALVILILGGAAAVTLLLGTIGLYGIMAYVVTLRRRELGIRIALGASPRTVSAATIRAGVALTGVGVVMGLGLFAVASQFIHRFLFGVAPWDPISIAGASLILLAMAAVASWFPARRAGRVDPSEALRAE